MVSPAGSAIVLIPSSHWLPTAAGRPLLPEWFLGRQAAALEYPRQESCTVERGGRADTAHHRRQLLPEREVRRHRHLRRTLHLLWHWGSLTSAYELCSGAGCLLRAPLARLIVGCREWLWNVILWEFAADSFILFYWVMFIWYDLLETIWMKGASLRRGLEYCSSRPFRLVDLSQLVMELEIAP